jgi:SAM-dependent methyltransferase
MFPTFFQTEPSRVSDLPTGVKDADAARWDAYYDATAGRPPRRTLLTAIDRFDGMLPRFAVDLGCGNGRDTIALLSRGWSVIAIDAAPSAIERLAARSGLPKNADLTTRCGKFETTEWPAVDLVNSSFALPLCPPDAFPALWDKITQSLKPDGRFAGQLYGSRDSWAGREGVTVFERERARQLFQYYEIELFDEEETDSVTPRGDAKHWHIFHVVARKR